MPHSIWNLNRCDFPDVFGGGAIEDVLKRECRYVCIPAEIGSVLILFQLVEITIQHHLKSFFWNFGFVVEFDKRQKFF